MLKVFAVFICFFLVTFNIHSIEQPSKKAIAAMVDKLVASGQFSKEDGERAKASLKKMDDSDTNTLINKAHNAVNNNAHLKKSESGLDDIIKQVEKDLK